MSARNDRSLSVADLIDLLQYGSHAAQLSAAGALGRRGPQAASAVPALIEALQSGAGALPRLAAAALGDLGATASAAVPALTAALRDGPPELRRRAVLALADIGGAGTVEGLRLALADGDEGVRRAAGALLDVTARRAA